MISYVHKAYKFLFQFKNTNIFLPKALVLLICTEEDLPTF